MSPNMGVFGTVKFCGSVELGFWKTMAQARAGLFYTVTNQAEGIA